MHVWISESPEYFETHLWAYSAQQFGRDLEMLLVDMLQYLTCITLCLPTGISVSNMLHSTLKQCMKPRPHSSSTFSKFIEIITTPISYFYLLWSTSGAGSSLFWGFPWGINIVALTVDTKWKLCCQTSKEVQKQLFQYPFTPEALIAARTFIPTFALPLITALIWHFSVMLTELLCVKQEACSLSWSHGRLCVLKLNPLAVWSRQFTQKVRLLATNLLADVTAALSVKRHDLMNECVWGFLLLLLEENEDKLACRGNPCWDFLLSFILLYLIWSCPHHTGELKQNYVKSVLLKSS